MGIAEGPEGCWHASRCNDLWGWGRRWAIGCRLSFSVHIHLLEFHLIIDAGMLREYM